MKEKKIVLSSALIIMLLLVIGVVPSQAQQSGSSPLADQTWVRLGGPLGGMGYDIRMSPDNPDIMYVTDANAGVHKSIDGGQIWVPINDGIDLRTGTSGDIIPVFCLTIDPNDNNIVWIGLQNLAGVYRSVDGGQTWERRTHRECCRGIVETDGFTVRGIAIEPGNSEVVYIAGEIHSWRWNGRVLMGRNFDMTKGVIYKTTDGGNNWSAIWRGDNLARYILIDPGNVETIYVSTGIFDREAANSNPEAGEPGGVGILKSTDGGQTWAQMNTGLENLYVGSLFMHPTDSQTLIAGIGNQTYQRGGGVYLTHDGGQHWMRVLARENYDYITSVEYALSNPDIAYAGGEHEFAISQDGGQTWISRTVNRFWGPGGIRPGFPIDFQIDPRDPERIFVNSYGGGNFLSEDGGQTWTSASMGYTGADLTDVSIDPQNPAIVYVNGRSGPFASMDGGLNWSGINPIALGTVAEGARVTLDPDDPSHILLSSAHRGWTYESFDGGTHWVLVTDYALAFESLPPGDRNLYSGMQAITFAPSDSNNVYGGFGLHWCSRDADPEWCKTESRVSLLISRDGGHSWTQMTGTALDGLSINEIVVHPQDPNQAWAATGGGVFITTDGGVSWEASFKGLTDEIILSLVGSADDPQVLYAGSFSRGVFKSVDGGQTWKPSSAGMDPNESISSLVVDPQRPNIIYAASWRSGVFLSEDSGSTWRLINDGLRMRAVRALALSADGETLYAATRGEGLYRLSKYGQEYFDSLLPTPTILPPTDTPYPTSVLSITPMPGAASPTATPTGEPGICGSAAILPLALLGLVWQRALGKRGGR